MELRVLRYFLTVVREESITRAAEVLHITQPTLSRQMNQLEEEVGVKLFTRGTRKIVLTNEGMLLRRRAEEISELVDKTEKELAVQDEMIEGTIFIGCGELASVNLLPGVLQSFSRQYPLVRYDLFTGTADQVKERMETGNIDIGLLMEPVDIDRYEYIRLNIKERWVVLMRPDDPLAQKEYITAKDLADLPLILPHRQNVQNEIANWFGECFKDLHILFGNHLTTNAAIMARNGLAYAVTIEGPTLLWDKEQICSRPLYPELTATSVLAWKRQQPFSRPAMKFIEHLKGCLVTEGRQPLQKRI